MQGREHEGSSLAGTGLRAGNDVAAFDGGGNDLRLHRGRHVVARIGERCEEGGVEPDFYKGHVIFRMGAQPLAARRVGGANEAGRATPTNERLRDRLCRRQTLSDQQESASIGTEALCREGAEVIDTRRQGGLRLTARFAMLGARSRSAATCGAHCSTLAGAVAVPERHSRKTARAAMHRERARRRGDAPFSCVESRPAALHRRSAGGAPGWHSSCLKTSRPIISR
ncbi:MAG: hypothetical protein AW12_02589 [Candidatus Accumulibacter sp. BA-94]|nr:MAG: hypothetical protein AW12_02589 [Candidatus Accumulibacter sp. BA-94]